MIVESYEDVILLSGALRSNFWDTIHTAISLTLKRHATGVIIDCSGITECTPEGAETFRDAMTFIERHDARVILAAVPQHVLEVLKTVPEVRSQLAISPSVEAARRSLDLLIEPEEKEKKKGKGARETRGKAVLYLPTRGLTAEGFELAEQVADSLHVEIVAAYILVVPRDLPIQAPLAEQEEQAVKAIEHAKSEFSKRDVTSSAVLERGREIASALQQVMDDTSADRLIVPVSPDEDALDNEVKLIRSILAKVTKPVALVRAAVKGR